MRKKVLIKCLPGKKLSGTNKISISLYFIFTAYNNRDLEMALKVDTEALYVTGVKNATMIHYIIHKYI